ncbi:hypothetical protein [Pseudoalteromonas sp. NC201]|uniref:hypothetical protein n=1 Tax=Pseudoalteromonas sp. NC201 TaxID=1514074 RepID=UPI000C7C03E3|nr:hypothetical protein [Pseudoalteromonas sp. NC201]AUJ70073.1 hypothetical protein PNC201_08900 [Pseudoalteromonas sp. NC201]
MKKIEDMTQEELDSYLANKAKERVRYYREEATEEEKEDFAKIEAYLAREASYSRSGVFYEEQPKDHLHDLSYKERLAKAEELNGCKFKDAKPCKDRFAPRDDFDGPTRLFGAWNCDGEKVAVVRHPSLILFRMVITILSAIAGFMLIVLTLVDVFLIDYLYLSLAGLFVTPFLLFKFSDALRFIDNIEFNRHTGLVRTPYTLFRKPFYIPVEDLEYVVGVEVKSARGGGSFQTGYLSCRKYPEKFWFGHAIGLRDGGNLNDWAQINRFMDTTQPIEEYYYEIMEYHYKLDKNAHFNGPFPEVMKKYFDADDCQINRWKVW